MAFSRVDVEIQNPATGKGKRMATSRRKMSAKQIKYFGTKRQKAALKAKRSAAHRPRTKPNSGGSWRKWKKLVKKEGRIGHLGHSAAERREWETGSTHPKKRKKNPTPMLISWVAGNPAKRSNRVAHSKKKKKSATAKRSNAGRRSAPKKTIHCSRRRSNPAGLGRPMDWLQGGAGVIAGVVGTRALPQMLLGASNTGVTGYAANAVAAVGLGWLTHMLFPRNAVLVTSVIAGGFAGLLSRIIADKTPFGQQLSLTGLGDHGFGLYQKSNFATPQRLVAPRGPDSSMFQYGQGAAYTPSLASAGSDSTMAC